MKLIIFSILMFIGCSSQTDYREVPFVDIDANKIYAPEHLELCKRKPDSVFCAKSPSIGDIQPTKDYAISILKEMNSNFRYFINDKWIYNNTVYEYLVGDCEDISSTMAKHMIDDGIDKKYLFFAYRKISETESHLFLAVDTVDAGILHLDYDNSGYKIEPRINFHMRLDDPGVYKWIKGNIR